MYIILSNIGKRAVINHSEGVMHKKNLEAALKMQRAQPSVSTIFAGNAGTLVTVTSAPSLHF